MNFIFHISFFMKFFGEIVNFSFKYAPFFEKTVFFNFPALCTGFRHIRSVSEKYPTCVHISALVLFFIIRTVASFEVVPIWLNHTLPAELPHLEAVLERRFWNELQLARRITLNVSMSSNRFPLSAIFNFWNI